MIERQSIQQKLTKKLLNNPAVVIIGPRQVGKTTLAKTVVSQRKVEYFDLESPNTLTAISIDVEAFLNAKADTLVVLDEVQLYPPIFGVLRSIIDQNRENGRFLLLGSANPALIRGVSESLAGRMSYLELYPFHLLEIGSEQQEKHWYRGGFPQAFLASEDDVFIEWVIDYVRAYVERDINRFFNTNLNPTLIRRLWVMLCHYAGGMLNTAEFGRSLGVSANTVNHYIEILEGAFLIHRLQPWHVNIKKRLVKSPKLYINDTGILHALLQIKSYDDLLLHPIIGASWENYVIQQIKSVVNGRLEMYFYRTHNGSEIDLLLTKSDRVVAAIEIKTSNNPKVSRGFINAIVDVKSDKNYLITRHRTYHTINNIKVISLYDFLRESLPYLMDN